MSKRRNQLCKYCPTGKSYPISNSHLNLGIVPRVKLHFLPNCHCSCLQMSYIVDKFVFSLLSHPLHFYLSFMKPFLQRAHSLRITSTDYPSTGGDKPTELESCCLKSGGGHFQWVLKHKRYSMFKALFLVKTEIQQS